MSKHTKSPRWREGSMRAKPIHQRSLNVIPFSTREQAKLKPIKNSLFSFSKKHLFKSNMWVYDDARLGVSNFIHPYAAYYPHLVLKDSKQVPRFVMGYTMPIYNILKIESIQRIRNEYLPHDSKGGTEWWSRFKERQMSKQLAKEIGMHPSEYLMMELLAQFREEILAGKLNVQVSVLSSKRSFSGKNTHLHKQERNLRPIIDRFFKKTPTTNIDFTYVLSLEKRRVKEALGII